MGTIRADVAGRHLGKLPQERDLLMPFLSCFDVTWATRHQNMGTEFSAYFLSPEQTVKDQFGIDAEILLIISDFSELQPRTMQAIDVFMKSIPALGRIDPTTIFLISPDQGLRDWIESYVALNPQFRVTVALTSAEIRAAKGDPWFIRNALSEQLFSRDLFDDQLPLRNDNFFFGRTRLAAEFVSAIKTGQNLGLFGLRKTGKTSLLFKVRRMAQADGVQVLYYDCKDPAIRELRWTEFLAQIIKDIRTNFVKSFKTESTHISRKFREIISEASRKGRICIIFDEIEWVSPVAVIDAHWRTEFVPFWQTMWTTQSEHRELSLVIAGVNPTVTELAEVEGVQNPLFGIISPRFLTGLDESNVRQMLGKFGKRMGIRFSEDAVRYMFGRYGGHPLLTRMAGSYINSSLRGRGASRPYTLTSAELSGSEAERDAYVMYYCPHVVSELKKFYPDEYEMLEWLVTGNEADFHEFSDRGKAITHLKHYGLVSGERTSQMKIDIPVLERFIKTERKRQTADKQDLYIVPQESRELWFRNRLDRIVTDIRRLDKLGVGKGRPILYGQNGFPEAEKLFDLSVVVDQGSLEIFLNTFNKCFVEPVEVQGRSQAKHDYFWNDVKQAYPELFDSLLRIKVYRNDAMHLELTQRSAQQLFEMRRRDFGDIDFEKRPVEYFLVQQRVVDRLFLASVVETDKLL